MEVIVMGRAMESKNEQLKYIKHRLQLLNEVGKSMDESASAHDLRQLGKMLEQLGIKVRVFMSDWENHQ
jgi:hypothetical protein